MRYFHTFWSSQSFSPMYCKILADCIWLLTLNTTSLYPAPPYCLTHGMDHDHDAALPAIDNSPAANAMLVSRGPSFPLFDLVNWLDWTVTDTVDPCMTVLLAFGIDRAGRTFAGCHSYNLLNTRLSYYCGFSISQKLSNRQIVYRAAKTVTSAVLICPCTE